jgi:hypothetical protein
MSSKKGEESEVWEGIQGLGRQLATYSLWRLEIAQLGTLHLPITLASWAACPNSAPLGWQAVNGGAHLHYPWLESDCPKKMDSLLAPTCITLSAWTQGAWQHVNGGAEDTFLYTPPWATSHKLCVLPRPGPSDQVCGTTTMDIYPLTSRALSVIQHSSLGWTP